MTTYELSKYLGVSKAFFYNFVKEDKLIPASKGRFSQGHHWGRLQITALKVGCMLRETSRGCKLEHIVEIHDAFKKLGIKGLEKILDSGNIYFLGIDEKSKPIFTDKEIKGITVDVRKIHTESLLLA